MPLTVSFLYHLIVGIFYIFFSTWFSCSTFKSEVRKVCVGVCGNIYNHIYSWVLNLSRVSLYWSVLKEERSNATVWGLK